MSCAVLIPVTEGTTTAALKRTWAAFADQTYQPRLLVAVNLCASPEVLALLADMERYFRDASRDGVNMTQVAPPRSAAAPLGHAGNPWAVDWLTVWAPGRTFHRDTLGHLSMSFLGSIARTIYIERDPGIFAVKSSLWRQVHGQIHATPEEALHAGRTADVFRRISAVPDYTPPMAL